MIRIGSIMEQRGRRFVCVALKPYVRVDGTPSGIATWQGQCAQCGEQFTFRRGIRFWSLTRIHCDKHKRKGYKSRRRRKYQGATYALRLS